MLPEGYYAEAYADTLNKLAENAGVGVEVITRGIYHVNGKPVEGLYATDDAGLIIATKSFVDKALDAQARIERLSWLENLF